MLLLPALAARGGKRRGGLPPHRGEAPDSGARWRIKVAGSGRYLYKENGTAIGSAHFFSLFELRADMLSGEPRELSVYAGHVCLVVNAASK